MLDFTQLRAGKLVLVDFDLTSTMEDVVAPVEKISMGTQVDRSTLRSAWGEIVPSAQPLPARPVTPQFAKKFKEDANTSWEAFQKKRAQSQQRATLKVAAFAVKARQLQLQRASAAPVLPNTAVVADAVPDSGQMVDRLPRSLLPNLAREDSGRINAGIQLSRSIAIKAPAKATSLS